MRKFTILNVILTISLIGAMVASVTSTLQVQKEKERYKTLLQNSRFIDAKSWEKFRVKRISTGSPSSIQFQIALPKHSSADLVATVGRKGETIAQVTLTLSGPPDKFTIFDQHLVTLYLYQSEGNYRLGVICPTNIKTVRSETVVDDSDASIWLDEFVITDKMHANYFDEHLVESVHGDEDQLIFSRMSNNQDPKAQMFISVELKPKTIPKS